MSTPTLGTADQIQKMNVAGHGGLDTTQHLANAIRQADERNLHDLLIVDVDAHHHEMSAWAEIIKYIEDPVIRHQAESGLRGAGPRALLHASQRRPGGSGRRPRYYSKEITESGGNPDLERIKRTMRAIGIDYQVIFPTPLLELGLHPDPEIETAVSWAYTRWFTEEMLPQDPRMRTMVYLPMNDPQACLRAVERFSDHEGVVGFMVTAGRRRFPVHDNQYMKLYRALEERGMPLGFHAVYDQKERMFEGMNRFLSVHALGFVVFNMVHMTNWVINGLPERFPNLDVIWIESGLAWVPFLMQRLDNEYLMRSSEAPLLQGRPSEYISRFYFSTQPLEMDNLDALELTMKMINAETQLLFSSDYPHWDFNLPSTIYDLPFLTERAKRRILGENAAGLFGIEWAAGPA